MLSIFQSDHDVFNALDLMENSKEFLEELKFGKGDGTLQYYLFNWKCPYIPSEKVVYLLPTKPDIILICSFPLNVTSLQIAVVLQ